MTPNKNWILRYERKAGDSLFSALLKARDIKDPGSYFNSASLSDLHDPFLFPDMGKACSRLQRAIKARERVVVYGDYDVDGITGAAQLVHVLRYLGAEVSYRVPHRARDGYGLHKTYVEELIEKQVRVLITVDCGVSCKEEVELAENGGLNVILTDHHHVPENPPQPFAMLHPEFAPQYPNQKLAGSGVAFKLASALLIKTENSDMIPMLTDLASMGTVADCVPLTGENRSIVKLGLSQMARTNWPGLRALMISSGTNGNTLTAESIGFQLGPRINAAGRIGEPMKALQTLLAEEKDSLEKSEQLEKWNQERRDICQKAQKEAEASLDLSQPLIMASSPNWPSGIVGLIAGRLQEKHQKPAFIMEDRGELLVGSARSLPGFHCVDALSACAAHLENFGGHAQAAGFSLKKENLEKFVQAMQSHASELFKKTPLTPELKLDFALQEEDLTEESIEKLERFAPFGIGNPKPVFLLKEPILLSEKLLGKEEKHLKLTLKVGSTLLEGVAFNKAAEIEKIRSAKAFALSLEKRSWRGKTQIQAQLVDFK